MASRKEAEKASRLKSVEWVEKAFEVLARKGVDGMRIDDVAAELGVTKGSFYWHFKDRAALLRAVAERWAGERTLSRLAAIGSVGDPIDRLRRLRDAALDVAAVDRAMREWARTDPKIARAVDDADKLVFDVLFQAFAYLGFPASEADLRAKTMIYAFVGQYSVHLPATNASAARYERLVGLLVAGAPILEAGRGDRPKATTRNRGPQ